ncbi:sulfatase-like hydrolase/transferase [Glaciecola sp. MH2013]|uniref:sulfatase-like hydrolase/transferase n=1 Tax=Glaciecola sp. MH2013 TaxID=2785524 RepID=UPI00189DE579|nr:sulfatase-like hydrolase/transferase [Glaciecola sp. MH2013]MBF7074027.1 sulfatase-like hydrolase/transferase [Glaciecola sp. MH2013]
MQFTLSLLFRTLAVAALAIFFLQACGGGSSPANNGSTELIDTPPSQEEPISSIPKNILLIISDDQGLDASSQYDLSNDTPITPHINALASNGLVFENAWATPACTTSRASLLTGLYPHNSGVSYVPAVLATEHQTLPQLLKQHTESEEYQSAVFGKWHLAGGSDEPSHPESVGIEYYAGNLFNMDDYYNWELTINGNTTVSNEYHTSKVTDLAIDWISQQSTPWFAWLAYSAPHSPFHLPPEALHSQNLSGSADDISQNPRKYYLAAIEAMDSEIGRLIESLSIEDQENTLIIFIGDNGTPQRVVDTEAYLADHAKGTLYEGSLAVPLVVSGAGVSRVGEREAQPVVITDLFATIAQAAGVTHTRINDSNSFYELLSNSAVTLAPFIFTEFESAQVTGAAVRSNDYKLIRFANGEEEFYSLRDDNKEEQNILQSDNTLVQEELLAHRVFLESIIPSQDVTSIDITNAVLSNTSGDCADYLSTYRSTASDIGRNLDFSGALSISISDTECFFETNAIPNHNFNDGSESFPNPVSEQNDIFRITRSPTLAANKTALSLSIDNAILLNGVKVDIIAAACFGVGNGKVGCNDMSQPWRYDPMHSANGFRVDSHHAHAQPDGTYHYHGSPMALFVDNNSEVSPVIGFAADGFPIYGPYFMSSEGVIRKAQSSYALKVGERPSGDGQPGGNYDGSFRDDYEFDANLGDLDECNGMTRDGKYAYYLTDTFPYVLGCFSGTINDSFRK